jgi:acetyl-CoA synthetase
MPTEALCAEAERDYAGYWARLAREHVSWKTDFTRTLDESNGRSTSGSRTAS